MEQKLIKLSEKHYIIVDDSEIKEGDWYWTPIKRSIEQCIKKLLIIKDGQNDVEQFKITHSTQPLEDVLPNPIMGKIYKNIKPLFLSEVEEAINGYDVEKMSLQNQEFWRNGGDYDTFELGYKEGFKAHQELVKDKLFTVNDLRKAIAFAWSSDNKTMGEIIESLLPKTEWDIEFVDGKIKLL